MAKPYKLPNRRLAMGLVFGGLAGIAAGFLTIMVTLMTLYDKAGHCLNETSNTCSFTSHQILVYAGQALCYVGIIALAVGVFLVIIRSLRARK